MNIVCVVICDNCGKNVINDPEDVSIFVVDDTRVCVTKCPKCKEPLTVELTQQRARTIAHKGVKVWSWNVAEEISPESI